MRFQRNRHSVFLLTYHLIMCIKYRHEVIDERLGVAIKSIAESVAKNHGITIVELGHDKVPHQGESRSCFRKSGKSSGKNLFGHQVICCLPQVVPL